MKLTIAECVARSRTGRVEIDGCYDESWLGSDIAGRSITFISCVDPPSVIILEESLIHTFMNTLTWPRDAEANGLLRVFQMGTDSPQYIAELSPESVLLELKRVQHNEIEWHRDLMPKVVEAYEALCKFVARAADTAAELIYVE